MNNFFGLSNVFLIVGFASAMAYFCLLLYFNSLVSKPNRCHLRNSYPSQFYTEMSKLPKIFLYIIAIIDMFALALGFFFFFYSLNSTYGIILGSLFAFSSLSLLVSNLLSLSQYKAHIAFAAASFFSFAFACILCSFTTVMPGAALNPEDINVVIEVIIGVIGFFSFFALFNKKLLNWCKMDRTEENGAVYYVKPKVNFFALYEWIYLISENVVAFLLFIDMIAVKLI
ncbi:MAG: hypothetical protein WCR56_00165 [Bacilli bacterium]